MNKILVTGVDGFIGSNFCKILLEDRFTTDIVGVVFRDNPNKETNLKVFGINKNIKKEECSLSDREEVFSLIKKYKPKRIYHFAAQAIVKNAQINPYFTFYNNFLSTLNLLEATRTYNKNIECFYYHSSDKVYGDVIDAETNCPYKIGEPYATSKIVSDALCLSYKETYNLPIIVGRSCNVYGPGDFNKRVIPNTIKEILKNGTATIYEGDDLMVRQYIYVDDLCKIIIGLYEHLGSNAFNQPWNIAPKKDVVSTEFIVKKLVEIGKRILGKKIKIIKKKKEGAIKEIQKQSLSTSFPYYEYTTLEDGLEKSFLWYIKHNERT